MTLSQGSGVIGKGDQALLQVAFERCSICGSSVSECDVSSELDSSIVIMHCVIGRLVAPCTVVQYERHDGALVESSMLHVLLWICISEYPSSVTIIVQVGQGLIDNGHRGECAWTGSGCWLVAVSLE